MPSTSEVLASFAAELSFDDLPAEVVAKARTHLLDLIGVALAAAPMPFAAAALAAADDATGPCAVIGAARRLPARAAALVNGTLAHGLDFDDTHQASVVHVSASAVPAALAAAETAAADGKQFLTALIAGMETAIRVGLCAPGAFHDHGFHPTGLCGSFASAVIGAKLLGLSAAETADALGLAGSLAAGSMEFLTDGTWSKRLHAGWAAQTGLLAAQLARQGFPGPRGVFDGRFGFYRSHLGDAGWSLEPLTAALGTHWHMLTIALKPYPCCHYNHAFIDAAAALQATHGLTADGIERIECFIHPRQIPVVCEPVASKRHPQTDYDAKFSLPYAVASSLARGHVDIDDFTSEAIADARVLDLAGRVECVGDPSADYPRRFPGRVRLTLRDRRVLEHAEPINRGSAERPLSAEEVEDKFRRNARRVLPAEQVAALIAAVHGVDRAPNVQTLAQLCVLVPPPYQGEVGSESPSFPRRGSGGGRHAKEGTSPIAPSLVRRGNSS